MLHIFAAALRRIGIELPGKEAQLAFTRRRRQVNALQLRARVPAGGKHAAHGLFHWPGAIGVPLPFVAGEREEQLRIRAVGRHLADEAVEGGRRDIKAEEPEVGSGNEGSPGCAQCGLSHLRIAILVASGDQARVVFKYGSQILELHAGHARALPGAFAQLFRSHAALHEQLQLAGAAVGKAPAAIRIPIDGEAPGGANGLAHQHDPAALVHAHAQGLPRLLKDAGAQPCRAQNPQAKGAGQAQSVQQ